MLIKQLLLAFLQFSSPWNHFVYHIWCDSNKFNIWNQGKRPHHKCKWKWKNKVAIETFPLETSLSMGLQTNRWYLCKRMCSMLYDSCFVCLDEFWKIILDESSQKFVDQRLEGICWEFHDLAQMYLPLKSWKFQF